MKYRKLPHGEENISILGLGMGSIHNSSPEEIEKTVRLAMEYGIISKAKKNLKNIL